MKPSPESIMRYKIYGEGLLEDLVKTGKAGINTAGFALSFLGLEYLNEKYLGNSMPISPENSSSPAEFVISAAQIVCFFGTSIEGVKCAYNTFKIPFKLVSGKNYNKKKIK